MWTTSRYASAETKSAARRLASVSGSVFCSRGKKTIAELAESARRSGESAIMIVEERAGKPSFVSSIEVLPDGGWRWAQRRGFDEHAGKGKLRGEL
jgi:rRNA maturation protein Rpf1